MYKIHLIQTIMAARWIRGENSKNIRLSFATLAGGAR